MQDDDSAPSISTPGALLAQRLRHVLEAARQGARPPWPVEILMALMEGSETDVVDAGLVPSLLALEQAQTDFADWTMADGTDLRRSRDVLRALLRCRAPSQDLIVLVEKLLPSVLKPDYVLDPAALPERFDRDRELAMAQDSLALTCLEAMGHCLDRTSDLIELAVAARTHRNAEVSMLAEDMYRLLRENAP